MSRVRSSLNRMSDYQRRVDAARAIQDSREANRQKSIDDRWRRQILSAEELAEYEQLHAPIPPLPKNLANRAAMPPIALLIVWSIGLLAFVWQLSVDRSLQGPLAGVAILGGLVIGPTVAIRWLLGRTRVATSAYTTPLESERARGLDHFLTKTRYEERLAKARQEASDWRDWDRRPTRNPRPR
jgi:hypothetical protein